MHLRNFIEAAFIIAIPGGFAYGAFKGIRALYRYIRKRQNEKRIRDMTFAAVMNAAELKYTDAEWKRLAKRIWDEPETLYDDVPELGWKAKAITQRKWGQS